MQSLARALFVFVLLGLASTTAWAQASGADTGPPLAGSWWLAALLGGAALVLTILLYVVPARAVAAAEERVAAAFKERALTLQEEDRRRIARELHDGAGQALTAARLQLLALRDEADPDRDRQATLARIMSHVDEAMDEVRRSTSALAPPALAELGLAGALERHCQNFAAASNLEVACEVQSALPPLAPHLETTCYRIAQEALHNTSRHAGAKRAWVRIAATNQSLSLAVSDDGVGMNDDAPAGFGLESIRERAKLVGGRVELRTEAGEGCRLEVTLPLQRSAA